MKSALTIVFAFFCTAPAAVACDQAPAPQRDITANSFYTDAHHSIVAPDKHAQNVASVEPLEDFGRVVVAMADKPDGESHACAVNWLAHWAAANAMLGSMSSGQAFYEREWMLAELALGYAKVKVAASPQQAKIIDAWLTRLAAEVVKHVDAKKGKRNNHYYWAGLAVAATGRVTGDEEATRWSRKVFDDAMAQIEDDGSLPNEMDRASRATNYHLFAAEPLVMLAAILSADSPKLAKLVTFCLAIINDQGIIARRTGFAQEPVNPSGYDWLAVYARRHPAPEIDALLRQSGRKPHAARLGGSLVTPHPLETAP